jgi:mannose-binding lectin 1
MVLKSVEDKIDEATRRLGAIESLNRRLESMERSLEQVRRDVEGKDYREHLDKLNQAIEGVRGGIADNLPDTIGQSKFTHPSASCSGDVVLTRVIVISASAPRMGMFIFIVLAVQIMLAGAYIVYKKRRANMPKKYL